MRHGSATLPQALLLVRCQMNGMRKQRARSQQTVVIVDIQIALPLRKQLPYSLTLLTGFRQMRLQV